MVTCTVTIRSHAGTLHTQYSGLYPSSIDAVMDALEIAPPFARISVIATRKESQS